MLQVVVCCFWRLYCVVLLQAVSCCFVTGCFVLFCYRLYCVVLLQAVVCCFVTGCIVLFCCRLYCVVLLQIVLCCFVTGCIVLFCCRLLEGSYTFCIVSLQATIHLCFVAGCIWARYSVVITPINYNLMTVNLFMSIVNGVNLFRAAR